MLLERQVVRRVSVDLVGRAEDERGLGGVLAGRLEQVERAERVDAEVGLGVACRPVVRGLGSGVDHGLDLPRQIRKGTIDAVGVADVDVEGAEIRVATHANRR